MRVESVSEAKGTGHALQRMPREGSKIRALYDFLEARKGIPIDIALTVAAPNFRGDIEKLRDFYGLDIRKISYGRWVLAGEWFGTEYRDYIAEHLASIGAGEG